MKFLTKMAIGVAILLLASAGTWAQIYQDATDDEIARLKEKPLHGLLGLSFINSVPQNEFHENLKRAGAGLSIYGGFNLAPVPISIGLQGDLLFYGWGEKYFSYYQNSWRRRDTVSYQNTIIPITAFVQFRPNIAEYFYPYFELLGGINMISASADYKSAGGYNDNQDEFAASWNYGIGAGLMVKLVDFVTLPSFYSRLLLDIKARYMRGTETKYHMVKQINDDTSPDFRRYSSKTDMATFQVGVAFEF